MFPKNAPMSPMSITGPVNTKTCPIGQTLSWYLNETITKLLRNADCYKPLNHTLTIGWAGAVRTSNTCVTRVATLTECLSTFRICTNWADVWIWLNKKKMRNLVYYYTWIKKSVILISQQMLCLYFFRNKYLKYILLSHYQHDRKRSSGYERIWTTDS